MSKYVVLDLEMCKVPKNMRTKEYTRPSETIQIGAVLVDENFKIVDRFMTFVKPKVGYVDSYIKNLTGITPFDVKDAPYMKEALEQFVDWIPEDAIAVAWSGSDESQIRYELTAKNIHIDGLESILDNMLDCQALFAETLKTKKKYNLTEALIISDIDFDENVHNGLIDAENTALLLIKIKTEPEFKLSEFFCLTEDGRVVTV